MIFTQMGNQFTSYMYQSDTSVSIDDSFTLLNCMTGFPFSAFWHYTILNVFYNNTSYNFELQDNELRIYYEEEMKSVLLEFAE